MEEPHDPQGACALGRYRLLYELGRGGAGIVYGARDERLGRRVAVKILQGQPQVPQAAARMAREAQALAALQHRNLVSLLDYGVEGGAPCLVMEWVDGVDLKRLAQRHAFTVPEILELLDQLLDGLSCCHAKGFVHRDLKPGNVLVERRAGALSVKLIDFGIVQLAGDPGATALTVAGQVFGSLRYMAPEQFTQLAVGPPTDLYAVGLLGYWLLLGGKHFIAPGTPAAILAAHLDPRRRPRPTHSAAGDPVPPALLDCLARACAPRPEDRPPDAAALQAALAPLRSAETAEAPMILLEPWDDEPTAPVPRGPEELRAALLEAARRLGRSDGAWAAPSVDDLLGATQISAPPEHDPTPLAQRLQADLVSSSPRATVHDRRPVTTPLPSAPSPKLPLWLWLAAAAAAGGLIGLALSWL